jgi:hypothetical protein
MNTKTGNLSGAYDQPDELNENEIEKYVYRKIRKDHIGSSYRFANVLFCV